MRSQCRARVPPAWQRSYAQVGVVSAVSVRGPRGGRFGCQGAGSLARAPRSVGGSASRRIGRPLACDVVTIRHLLGSILTACGGGPFMARVKFFEKGLALLWRE